MAVLVHGTDHDAVQRTGLDRCRRDNRRGCRFTTQVADLADEFSTGEVRDGAFAQPNVRFAGGDQ